MLHLPLRNRVAEWGLAALADPAAVLPLQALAAFVAAADSKGRASGLLPAQKALLAAEKDLFQQRWGTLRLRDEWVADLTSLRSRVARFSAIVAQRPCGPAPFNWADFQQLPDPDGPEPDLASVNWSLCAAAVLFNQTLYFETHEVLEPVWLRARGELKTFLQGLIQVAVALHHDGNGNRRGAELLLAQGNDKLLPLRPAYGGVELSEFCAAVAACGRQVSQGQRLGARPVLLILTAPVAQP